MMHKILLDFIRKKDREFTTSYLKHIKNEHSFTLIELLIVIGILAVLAVAVVLVINPAEMLKQARDSVRLSDMETINKALAFAQTQGITSFGTSTEVYVSIPDPALSSGQTSSCPNMGLPSLPSGYSYRCTSGADLTKINGWGWIPANLESITIGSPIEKLPVDPVNTAASNNYYTYIPGGSWALGSFLESQKYIQSKARTDGGYDPERYEAGTDLALWKNASGLTGYWTFDEGSGTSVRDSSGNNNNGVWNGSGGHWTTGKVGGFAGNLNGTDDRVLVTGSSGMLGGNYSIATWLKFTDSGQKAIIGNRNFGGGKIFHGTNGGTLSQLQTGCNPPYANSGVAINDNTWHFAALTFNSSSMVKTIYIDGVQNNLVTQSGCEITGATQLYIGYDWGNNFPGSIDDARIYNRVLSSAEIQAIYNATK